MTSDGELRIRTGRPGFDQNTLRQSVQLSELVHKFGHELGNPLTSVISYSSVLERVGSPGGGDIPPEKIAGFAHSIGLEAWKVSHVVERLVLLLSDRINEDAATDVSLIITRLPTKLRNRYNLSNVDLEIKREDVAINARIDSEQFLSLITEIVLNGWEAEQELRAANVGTPTAVKITYRAINDQVQITVKNRVSSKHPEDLSNLFNLFEKYPREKRCLGVGLTVCAAIVARHYGSIELREELNDSGGTMSTIVNLPIAKEKG